MSEENVTLISKDYIDSNFITSSDERVVVDKSEIGYDLSLNGSFIERDEYTELENKVNGKQDTLIIGTGINLSGSTISVDVETVVVDSNLPVTAGAVNTKLGDYVSVIMSSDDSINITKNGSVVDMKADVVAPVPEQLGTTELLHSHVYTLVVAADTDLSALTVKQYATCELWLDYTAGSVTWPTGIWWEEGSAPTLTTGKSYAIALRNDGVKLRANVQYEDTTPA